MRYYKLEQMLNYLTIRVKCLSYRVINKLVGISEGGILF
jgi:hypothetical protein